MRVLVHVPTNARQFCEYTCSSSACIRHACLYSSNKRQCSVKVCVQTHNMYKLTICANSQYVQTHTLTICTNSQYVQSHKLTLVYKLRLQTHNALASHCYSLVRLILHQFSFKNLSCVTARYTLKYDKKFHIIRKILYNTCNDGIVHNDVTIINCSIVKKFICSI